MIRRAFIALLWASLSAGAGYAQQTAQCWYPVDQEIACSSEDPADSEGMLKPGFHAIFSEPTNRYGHGVLGNTPEWGALTAIWQGSPAHGPYYLSVLTLPKNRIFEDIAPRLADVTGDGNPEIIVIETDRNKGARLSVYAPDLGENSLKLLAATPFIGTPFRWLAPVGIADFNGDGDMDLAYVDRPHLAKTLRVWTYREGALHEIASLEGVTNHKIGQNRITGGVRDCGQGPEMVLVDANWRNVLAVRMDSGALKARKIAAFKSARSVEDALACRD